MESGRGEGRGDKFFRTLVSPLLFASPTEKYGLSTFVCLICVRISFCYHGNKELSNLFCIVAVRETVFLASLLIFELIENNAK